LTPLAAAILVALQVGPPVGRPFAERAVAELAALRPAVTATAWLATHPGDEFLVFRRDSLRENHKSWCARAGQSGRLSDGTRMVRYAYFYPPEPPPSLVLPAANGPNLVREQCVLGTVWVEARAIDSATGSALAASVRDALTGAYGPVRAGQDFLRGRVLPDSVRRALSRLPGADAMLMGLHYFGAGGWRIPGRWEADSTVIVSAFDRGLDPRQSGGRVLAFASLPIAKLGSVGEDLDRGEALERRIAALALEAARLSGLDTTKARRLLGILADADSAYHERGSMNPKILDSVAVVVIRDWTMVARSLAPSRRAAALLAADQVLGSGPMLYVRAQRQDTSRVGYERLGAVFVRDELGGGYNYTHNWLDQALKLDANGPVGRLATLALLRSGFNETGMCGGGSEAFRRVITAGERLLAGDLDTATAADVHRLVGDAYADIVALAAGDGSGYADSTDYLAEAPAARGKAITHYRTALALDRVSPEARSAWLEAWRLIAGLPPTTTHFFCVYD
jgi:hypothetical protein